VATGLDSLSRLPMMFGIQRQPDSEPTGFDEATFDEAEVVCVPDERERVVSFRFDQLVFAGYDDRRAARLAENFAVDWHRAVDLLKAGCDPRTAEAILA
jgi:hypothetical protein